LSKSLDLFDCAIKPLVVYIIITTPSILGSKTTTQKCPIWSTALLVILTALL
jgi:hypothetical protein